MFCQINILLSLAVNAQNHHKNGNNANNSKNSVIHYEKYAGKFITAEEFREHVKANNTVYTHIEDIDLLMGMWLERRNYRFVAPTFYCLVVEQLKRTIMSDRHWYERPNRPNVFTLEQLLEIRKATIARFLCDVGDSVTEIQPKAFLRAGR